MYLALGIIFLIISLLLAAGIIIVMVRSIKSDGELISKKNMLYLAPTFLIVYLLHITASVFNGEDIDFFYCFSLIYTTLDVLKFKAVKNLLMPICEAYPIFYVDFVLAFIIGVLTVILSVASFFSRRINNYFIVRFRLGRKCDVVFGDSEDAVNYVKNTKNSVLIGAHITGQRYADLLKQKVAVLRVPFEIKHISRKLKKGGYNVVVFRDGKYSYTKIIEIFTALNKKCIIHFEANQQEMKILREKFITKADKNSNLYFTGFSKYELMARRFVVEHPITKYIPRSFYNANYTLKSNKQINVVFIGFGKVNYQLFRMCAMQFQFAQEKGGKLASKPVCYHIYDKENAAMHNEFFSRILYEFDEEFADCDFPKPEKICDIKTHERDINSVEAKKDFKKLVTEDSFTYFIISLDNDLEDASYAHTVMRLFEKDTNYHVFVRAKNNNGEKLNELNDRITYFGEEKKLYTHESIVNDDLLELAKKINILYNDVTNPPEWLVKLKDKEHLTADAQRAMLNQKLADSENKEFMLDRWAALPYIEQASNLYHALNLPFKLNLLGFDMVKMKDENDRGITEAEFNQHYVNSGRESNYGDYSFFFKTESSNVLAYIEHSRWNALYILYDYKQMDKADMKVVEEQDENGNTVKSVPHKNKARKRHACLTTYYGLDELVKFKYGMLYPSEKLGENDYTNARLKELGKVYAYDYMDLDRLYSEITAMGYKIRKSGKNEEKNG